MPDAGPVFAKNATGIPKRKSQPIDRIEQASVVSADNPGVGVILFLSA
tara:strand:+ start:2392 stop:2535 length:144 start_codon:yes stop_codon:yes gene_type:complete